MSKISGRAIIHPDATKALNDGWFIPYYTDMTYVRWLEHVILHAGPTPDQDKILIRHCCVNKEAELMAMNLCWFIRGNSMDVHSCAVSESYDIDAVYKWEPYVEYPPAYS